MVGSGRLGFDTTFMGKWFPTFQCNVSLSSRVQIHLQHVKVEWNTFLQNVGNHLPSNVASQPSDRHLQLHYCENLNLLSVA